MYCALLLGERNEKNKERKHAKMLSKEIKKINRNINSFF